MPRPRYVFMGLFPETNLLCAIRCLAGYFHRTFLNYSTEPVIKPVPKIAAPFALENTTLITSPASMKHLCAGEKTEKDLRASPRKQIERRERGESIKSPQIKAIFM